MIQWFLRLEFYLVYKMNTIIYKILCFLIFIASSFSQNAWYKGNLKKIDQFNFKLNLNGTDDDAWGRRLENYIELRFLENGLEFVNNQMPKFIIDINIVDSKVELVSSFLVVFSIYNYSVSEQDYYQFISDGELTKKLMTSKIFSQEIMGQTSSSNLYKDIEKSINKLISNFFNQWYNENPMKQF